VSFHMCLCYYVSMCYVLCSYVCAMCCMGLYVSMGYGGSRSGGGRGYVCCVLYVVCVVVLCVCCVLCAMCLSSICPYVLTPPSPLIPLTPSYPHNPPLPLSLSTPSTTSTPPHIPIKPNSLCKKYVLNPHFLLSFRQSGQLRGARRGRGDAGGV
jgi:hypothetical protein